ncbi:MAG: hypothetical protein H5T83_08640, partial [Actinotalea sp.]|nr:hypothetical protein [Actinotalea sp.]
MSQVRTRGGGASARSLARRLGLPAARGAAVGALAVTVVVGGGAGASAATTIPGGPAVPVIPSGSGQDATTGETSTPAQRLAALGEEWSHARLADALAVGHAALDAAHASAALAGTGPDVDALRSSVQALRTLVRLHEGTAVVQRAGGGAQLLPDSVTAPVALTTAERLVVVQDVAARAAEVFRLALEVEATATATTGPGLPGLDAPSLQLTRPQPLTALAAPEPVTEAAEAPAAPAAGPDTAAPAGAPADTLAPVTPSSDVAAEPAGPAEAAGAPEPAAPA